MFYAYVLKSVHHDYYYKGHCENLEERLKRSEAIAREKYFKSSAGTRFLKMKLAPWFNARPADASRTGIE